MHKDIVFFGIQWSGKWTQADLFMEKYSKYKYLEPWQVFRALTSNKNIISDHIYDRMSKWKMLDDKLAFDLFNMYFHLLDKDDLILTDWFPRTIAQMYYFLSREAEHKRDFVWVHFELSREKAIERILKRAKEQWRKDDVLDSIKKRIDTFEKETLPVINYFKQINKLIVLDSSNSIDEVNEEFVKKMEKHKVV